MAESLKISVKELMKQAGEDSEDDFGLLQMHRFPAGLRDLGDRYIVPKLVVIGLYHHAYSSDHDHLKKMEKVKRAAGGTRSHLIKSTGLSSTWRAAPASSTPTTSCRRAWGMILTTSTLRRCCSLMPVSCCITWKLGLLIQQLLFSNRACIDNDIMLLENQLPWLVVQAIIDSLPQDQTARYMKAVERFIARMGGGFNKIREEEEKQKQTPFDFVWDEPRPPHLLGLLRRYKTGKVGITPKWPHVSKVSASSAVELAEIGIKLTASETALFTDMDVRERGPLCGKLSLPPLSLNNTRSCCLVNMAAFEVATVSSYRDHPDCTAVCSYLALFSVFMLQEEDVKDRAASQAHPAQPPDQRGDAGLLQERRQAPP